MQKSIESEMKSLRAIVKKTENKIRRLVTAGKKVHIIWDFDFVLATGRSEDVFALSGNLQKYFEYEERLIHEVPDAEAWVLLAEACGMLHQSQDIVTARSSFMSHRVMLFSLAWNLPIRWTLFLGHQSKKESFRIILESLASADWHVFLIDDNEKHVRDFRILGRQLGWKGNIHGVVAPRIRQYTRDELAAHCRAVMEAEGEPHFVSATHNQRFLGQWMVLPEGRKQFRRLWLPQNCHQFLKEEIVDRHRSSLEKVSSEITPLAPKTTSHLHALHEMILDRAVEFGNWVESGIDAEFS